MTLCKLLPIASMYILLVCSSVCQCGKLVTDVDNEITQNTDDGCNVDGKVYKKGEQWSKAGECILYTCHSEDNFSGVLCPLVHFEEKSGCYETKMDKKKRYPDCCPNVICPQ